jgi:hypothetical protein
MTAAARDTGEEEPLTPEQFARAPAIDAFGWRSWRLGVPKTEQR